jgi:hypothetical protein
MYSLDTAYQNQIIFLDSQNAIRKTIDGVGEYVYSFQHPITLPVNCDMLLSVTDCQFPNTIPNITSLNNQISFSIPTFSKFFTITIIEEDGTTDKVYSVSEWISFVNAKIILEAVGQFSLYAEFFPNSSKIKWFSNFPFSIIDNSNYPTTSMDLIGGAKNPDGTLKYVSGDILLSSVVSPSYHITMPSTVHFSGTRFIFLKFKNISVNNINSNGVTDNAMVRIDNNAPYGYYIFYRPMEVQRFLMHKRTIHNITFRLTDTKGNDLNIWSADAQITMKIEFIYKPKLRSMEEGTISYELRKLAKIAKLSQEEFEGEYNPETNSFE